MRRLMRDEWQFGLGQISSLQRHPKPEISTGPPLPNTRLPMPKDNEVDEKVMRDNAASATPVAGLVTGYLPESRSVEIRLDESVPAWVKELPRRAYLVSREELDAVGQEGRGHNADWCAGWNAKNLAEAQHAATVTALEAEVAENEGVIAVWRRRCEEAERRVAELEAALRMARDELGGLPHSLGYEFTHLPKIDEALTGDGAK